MRMYDPFSVSLVFREYEFELQNQGFEFWKQPEYTSFMNLELDSTNINQSTREPGSLFEIRIGLDQVVNKEKAIFEGPIPLSFTVTIGGLLFLA